MKKLSNKSLESMSFSVSTGFSNL